MLLSARWHSSFIGWLFSLPAAGFSWKGQFPISVTAATEHEIVFWTKSCPWKVHGRLWLHYININCISTCVSGDVLSLTLLLWMSRLLPEEKKTDGDRSPCSNIQKDWFENLTSIEDLDVAKISWYECEFYKYWNLQTARVNVWQSTLSKYTCCRCS